LLPDAANMPHSGQLSELQTDAPVSLTLSPDEVRDVAVPLVLIADANPASRTRRSQQLEMRGFRVSVARTGFEAIVKACCHLPNFILMDESLGDDDVAETMTLLATCPATSHIPVVRLGPGRRLPVRMLSSVVRHR
jgi:response regulator RpfG family c-di-GMP phosphodiesterase